MAIPEALKEAIEAIIASSPFHALKEAREELTQRYRHQQMKGQDFMDNEMQRISYLVTRMPATYAVIARVLQNVRSLMPDLALRSFLDLGAGPGTAMWAAAEVFPEITQFDLMEKDADLAGLGQRLAVYHPQPAIKQSFWHLQDLEQASLLPPHDLIVLSYAVGELAPAIVPHLIEACWKATNQCLVIIEPGTPIGFERIRAIRRQLIALGAYMVAPCPRTSACPMIEGDWCHFSERVERSSLHRRMKEGTLGYEDEKFSYVAVSKRPCELPYARVLRHPLKKSGHMILTLCTADHGKQIKTLSKKDGDLYKKARKLEWGSDIFIGY